MKKLIAERELARKKEDWQQSDRIRDEIKKLGYEVKDTENGPVARLLGR